MGLLRNSDNKEMRNPEHHIGRLQHFASGIGLDLTSLKGDVTGKLFRNSDDADNAKVDFRVHDEGLDTPRSVIEGAEKTLLNEGMAINPIAEDALGELMHRTPYHVGVINKGDAGRTNKTVINHGQKPNQYITHGWGGLGNLYTNVTTPQDFKSALENTRAEFTKQNRERSVPNQDVKDMVQHALRNPDEQVLQDILRNRPHLHSSQFVKVEYWPKSHPYLHFGNAEFDDIAYDVDSDVLDLKTGSWAKMHPDGYFPD